MSRETRRALIITILTILEGVMVVLTVLILIALAGTVGALVLGIASMAHGGEFDRRHSHLFMFARVGFQGIALVMLIIALLVSVR